MTNLVVVTRHTESGVVRYKKSRRRLGAKYMARRKASQAKRLLRLRAGGLFHAKQS